MENKKESPFTTIKKWFLSNDNSVIPEEIIKKLSIKSILCMFSGNEKITPYLNKYFNNFNINKIDIIEFCKFLKYNVIKNISFGWNDFNFLKNNYKTKKINNLKEKLPHLKEYEIEELLKVINDDKEFDGYSEYLGLLDNKSKKITKKERKEFLLDSESIIEKITKSEEIISFQDWCKNFN